MTNVPVEATDSSSAGMEPDDVAETIVISTTHWTNDREIGYGSGPVSGEMSLSPSHLGLMFGFSTGAIIQTTGIVP